MAWVYTVVLVACSAGILTTGAVLTRRLFRDETLVAPTPTGRPDTDPVDTDRADAEVTP